MESSLAIFAPSLAAAARSHLTKARDQVTALPRAGGNISNRDAAQLVTSLYQVVVEALENQGDDHRTALMEDVIPAAAASGMPLVTVVKGIARSYVVFCAEVIPDLPPDARGPAGLWLGEFVGTLLGEAVQRFGESHGNQ